MQVLLINHSHGNAMPQRMRMMGAVTASWAHTDTSYTVIHAVYLSHTVQPSAWENQQQNIYFIYSKSCGWIYVEVSSPGGVGYVDASQIDALTAHYEERGEAEQRHPAADHGQLRWLPCAELQLLDDVAPQHDAHASAGHND